MFRKPDFKVLETWVFELGQKRDLRSDSSLANTEQHWILCAQLAGIGRIQG